MGKLVNGRLKISLGYHRDCPSGVDSKGNPAKPPRKHKPISRGRCVLKCPGVPTPGGGTSPLPCGPPRAPPTFFHPTVNDLLQGSPPPAFRVNAFHAMAPQCHQCT
ncbi:hypothetical protein CEXT_98451 [Caerostris extrusa]|uniref:Uncharacterized protein n=1 Tax=Caerostris extrusa TaxID=172846 RepID=A0AAV4S220_CAEEX|nr:hypothetical protein CEXT_98451 [Caerostris extrusa]